MPTANTSLTIDWIVHGVTGSSASEWSSSLASNRYRAILPARALIEQGHRVRLLQAASWSEVGTAPPPDLIVIGKLIPRRSQASYQQFCASVLSNIAAWRQRGVPVLADFNDDHFDHPETGDFWRSLVAAVDVCVAGSAAMSDRLRQLTGAPIHVVGDPIGSPVGTPKTFRPSSRISGWTRSLLGPKAAAPRLALVWYGNPMNWPAMQAWAEAIASLGKEQQFVVWLVTKELDHIASFVQDYNNRFAPNALLELVPWDEATQWDVVSDANVVLIPSNVGDPKLALKTSNRLTDALHAGRYVVASGLPSYLPFAPYVALTSDPLVALRQYLAAPDVALEQVRQGQAKVLEECSSEQIVSAWSGAFALSLSCDTRSRPVDAPVVNYPLDSKAELTLEMIHRANSSKVSDTWQSYFEVYDTTFRRHRHDAIALLEIGVQNGGSLEVWSEYFPNARAFVGCDINPLCAQLTFEDPRISVIVGDANQEEIFHRVTAVSSSYDCIIDDGSQVSGDILRSFCLYFPHVAPGGVYVVEDTHTMYSEAFQGGIPKPTTSHEFFKRFVDLVNYEHWQNDLPLEDLFLPFFAGGGLPGFLREGWVEGVEFRNSMVIIRKAMEPSHFKLGERVVSNGEARVHRIANVRGKRNAAQRLSAGTAIRPLQATSVTSLPAPNSDLRELAVLQSVETSLKDGDLATADALLTPFATQSANVGILVRLAKIRMMQGARDEAFELLKKAELHHPFDRNVWEILAELLMIQGRVGEELEYRRKLAFQDVGATSIGLAAFDLARVSESAPGRVQDGGKLGVKPAVLPIRLNLGCGDKILEGYINVDVVAARAGRSPNVICDLRELTPFVSNYADEVMAVHVVEHFWRWEVADILKEWVRVLKPGGKFILECPNLRSACEAFLADPELRSAEGKQGQTTMWVFYGDPQWKDPLMVHRWGYTPSSLGKLMSSVGLVDVRQEPAQYKLREPRDMRIVGRKPL